MYVAQSVPTLAAISASGPSLPASSDGRTSTVTGGFEHGGWSVPFWDDQMGQVMGEFMGKPFDLILGRRTYEVFAAHWPYTDEPGAAELNRATKYVASRTLDRLDWENSRLLEGEVAEAVARLKEEDGRSSRSTAARTSSRPSSGTA